MPRRNPTENREYAKSVLADETRAVARGGLTGQIASGLAGVIGGGAAGALPAYLGGLAATQRAGKTMQEAEDTIAAARPKIERATKRNKARRSLRER
jgi:hypothetical protein